MYRRVPLCSFLLIVIATLTPFDRTHGDVLTQGTLSVEINELGLITGAPGGSIVTIDGNKFTLEDDIAEWFGIMFQRAGVDTTASGSGAVLDWDANRSAVTVVSFEATDETAIAVCEVAGLELRSEFFFDAGDLICTVTLSNLTLDVISNVMYSREWLATPSDPIYWTFPYDLPSTPAAAGVARRLWMTDDIPPGSAKSLTFSYERDLQIASGGPSVDVPLSLWTNADFPSGLNYGSTNGVSFGDYDADGRPDVFACSAATLWRNIDGETWELVADLDSVLPFTARRYGSSFGDYDNDGLPDIGTEPRDGWGGDECFHLLRNLGGETFVDVAIDSAIIDLQPCNADAESICWGDVDCDHDLDMFLPVYPPWAFGGPGNFFLENNGPAGPAGAYTFSETSAAAGVDNPPGTARSEGAQFVDLDSDGDMELYCNGTLYQNQSSPGSPLFGAMTQAASGILFSTQLEEGCLFADYDLDGDFDFSIVYTGPGVRIYLNQGDGTFSMQPVSTVAGYLTGLDLGMSAEDWDNDGDMDFTTRQVFRKNQLMETGELSFTVASHSIPSGHITSATPAWADWDRDGDLDCALGNWLSTGRFYENTLYDGTEPLSERRYIRVRCLDDTMDPAGLETAYATTVEVAIRNTDSTHRFKKFVSSSGGYLNQNEYTLHFALPADPAPGDDADDVNLDIIADFPNLPVDGYYRVDRHVNPALGNIDVADLAEREVVIYRSGRVSIDGVEFLPTGYEAPLLITAAGGLEQPSTSAALAAPVDTAGPFRAGLAFDTFGASERVRIREILIDGLLQEPSFCFGELSNVELWDITDPSESTLVRSLAIPPAGNHRSVFPSDILLAVDREYRLIAKLSESRATTVSAPIAHPNLTVLGGVAYYDSTGCTGDEHATAVVDPTTISASIRFAPVAFVAEQFVRGDCNEDATLDVADAIYFLTATFGSGVTLNCDDACDFNDDAMLDVADAVTLLDTLFSGGAPLPGPSTCGDDPTPDSLECVQGNCP